MYHITMKNWDPNTTWCQIHWCLLYPNVTLSSIQNEHHLRQWCFIWHLYKHVMDWWVNGKNLHLKLIPLSIRKCTWKLSDSALKQLLIDHQQPYLELKQMESIFDIFRKKKPLESHWKSTSFDSVIGEIFEI